MSTRRPSFVQHFLSLFCLFVWFLSTTVIPFGVGFASDPVRAVAHSMEMISDEEIDIASLHHAMNSQVNSQGHPSSQPVSEPISACRACPEPQDKHAPAHTSMSYCMAGACSGCMTLPSSPLSARRLSEQRLENHWHQTTLLGRHIRPALKPPRLFSELYLTNRHL